MASGAEQYVDDAMTQPVDVMCGDLFDHIDDLLDFPNDDDVLGMGDCQCGPAPPAPAPAFTPLLPPLHADGLLGGDGGGGGDCSDGPGEGAGGAASAFHRGEEKLVPWDDLDIADLEWLSSFFDDNDSFTVDLPKCNTTTAAATTPIGTNDRNNNSGNSKEDSLFRTSSPVSVLEPNSLSIGGSGGGGSSSSSSSSFSSSSSSCSGIGGGSSGARAREAPPISHPEPILVVPARARSKRPRPATFSSRPHVTIPFLPTSSDNMPAPTPVASFSSQSESFGESNPGPATLKQQQKKKKKKKKSSAGAAAGGDEAPPVRKCMHCEIQKTPQWRAGPMGPKTLCNACGVRYKSGRLFPEYRPAASPTFVPSLHSNSHRKVVEMRLQASQSAAAAGLPSLESASKDSCDLLAYIRRRE